MKSFLKYHVASGDVVSKLEGMGDADMQAHIHDGYDIISYDGEFAGVYVVDNAVHDRTTVSISVPATSVEVGATLELSGIPEGAWGRVNVDEPVEIQGGKIAITGGDNVLFQLVGKFACEPVFIKFIDLGAIRVDAKASIDAAAEAARAKVQTPGSGQAVTYLRKADAARAFLAGNALTDAQQQRLQDEATRTGVSLEEAAAALVANAEAWEAIDAQIDAVRLSSKAAIDTATDAVAIAEIVASAAWPA